MSKMFDIGSLPSLNALRAFVLVASTGSVKGAAEIIHVTPSAVTHQIRSLEAFLGFQLFTRCNNRIALTPEGKRLYEKIHGAFALIASGLSQVCFEKSEILRVSTLPTLAQFWLIKRLARFHALHPTIQIHLSAALEMVDFATSNCDVEIRFGRGVWPGIKAWKLMDEELFPVCSPAYLEAVGPLTSGRDLKPSTMISIRPRPLDWALWQTSAGFDGIEDMKPGYVFENSALALEAARHGIGIAIGRATLVMDDIRSGTLIRPFEHSCRLEEAYWLCCPEAFERKPEIVAFRRWLEVESRSGPEGRPMAVQPLAVAAQ